MSVPLSGKAIRPLLDTESLGSDSTVLETVGSTNDFAKEHLQKHGAVVLSEEQTGGRGRLGRQWLSPKGKGLWMSAVLRPDKKLESVQLITLASGLAVVRALEKIIEYKKLSLKWPNDVFLNGKKVCGILVESQIRGGRFDRIVIGIGLNVGQAKEDFPDDLRYPASSLWLETKTHHDRNLLAAAILNELEPLADAVFLGKTSEMLAAWKSYCSQVNKPVEIEGADQPKIGVFRDVLETGAVLLELSDGSTREITVGEISLVG